MCGVVSSVSSYNYDSEWNEVEKIADEKPKSALQLIEKIHAQAQKEDNAPQQLRCIVKKGLLRQNIDDASFMDCIKNLRMFREKCREGSVAASMALYIEGRMLSNYYSSRSYVIRQRTDLADSIPEDIEEWTENVFHKTIKEKIVKALSNQKLKETSARDYEPLLVTGADGATYRPTLFDLIVQDCRDNNLSPNIFSRQELLALLQEAIDSHKDDEDKCAYTQACIDWINYNDFSDLENQNRLENLLNEVKDTEASMLVRSELCKVWLLTCRNLDYQSNENISLEAIPQKLIDCAQTGIKEYPRHKIADYLRKVIEEVNAPTLRMELLTEYPGKDDTIRLKLSYANVTNTQLTIKRYKKCLHKVNRKDIKADETQKISFQLEKSNYFIRKDTIVELPPLNYGSYTISSDLSDEVYHRLEFLVTDLFYLHTDATGKKNRNFILMSSQTGAPKENVEVVPSQNSTRYSAKQTDKNGYVSIDLGDNGYSYSWYFDFIDGEDKYLSEENHYFYGKKEKTNVSDNEGEYYSILTDRSIYRPGQTIHFKVIAYKLGEKSSSTLAKKEIRVELLDANHQSVNELDLTTNDFGSVSSSFVLPEGGMAGTYALRANGRSLWVQVEEYKRPTFEVGLTVPQEAYAFGDTVRVSGRADYLMGAPVSNATISYKVFRKPLFFWNYYENPNQQTTLAQGEMQLSEDGTFSIPFFAQGENNSGRRFFCRFVVSAKVTDANGETQENEISVFIGDVSLAFSSSLQKRMTFNEFSQSKFSVINVESVGIANQKVDVRVLQDKKEIYNGTRRSKADGSCYLDMADEKWMSGEYEIRLKTLDDKNRVVEDSFEVVLYRESDRRPPVQTVFWTEKLGEASVDVGETHEVRIGSSLPTAHLLVITTNANGKENREWVTLNNEIKTLPFNLKEIDGVELRVDFYLVSQGKCYHESLLLKKKMEEKKLPIVLSTFRDKLRPGSNETWTIIVPKGKETEVVATMYDASLDKFSKLVWNFSPIYQKYVGFNLWKEVSIPHYGYRCSWVKNVYPCFTLRYDRLIDFPSVDYGFGQNMICYATCNDGAKHKLAKFRTLNVEVAEEESMVADAAPMMANLSSASAENAEKVPLHIRTNFAETAFFYPQLTADTVGNVQFSFQVPESLTRWNFMALGHTKDLFFGSASATAVTQKDFMVSPNLPRFLRRGDEMALTAKVLNLSDKTQNGTATVQLLDPYTENVVAENHASFSVPANGNTVVLCNFSIPREYDILIVRTIAKNDNFSDAEQTLLPVLSDRTVLTQSVPLYVRGGQTKTFTLESLKNNRSETLSSRFLKMELTANPIWYAVQALPSVATVEYENAASYAAAHFATMLATHIAQSNPKIFNIISIWKQKGESEKTLISQLEKNKEVQDILLSETPWVLDAKNETEQRQRLATLFNLNDLKGKSELWTSNLKKLQNENGAYTWFKGMLPSRHISLFVLDNFGRLRQAGLVDEKFLKNMKVSATLRYLDEELKRDYENWKKYEKSGSEPHIWSVQLYYFYVRGMFPNIPVPSSIKTAFDFYYKLIGKQWKSFSLYDKALAAVVLYENGDKKTALRIVESLREYSTTTDELGMFWEKNTGGYLWQDAAIGTHTRIMEAFQLIDPEKEEQDELRLWLLSQKRTQNWDNLIANVDALKVLLLSGSDWLSAENNVSVRLGGESLRLDPEIEGLDYSAVTIDGGKITPSMGTVELTSQPGGNISWGALYWQYEEEFIKLPKNKTALHIERSVMLEQSQNGKSVLKRIDGKTKLRVGDKLVVRLTLRTDRDLDYVSLRDQRASCLEPTQQISGYKCQQGTCFYQSPKDAAMYFFFDHLAKGTYVFEYPLWITHSGTFSGGVATAQCLYAPEFSTNSDGVKLVVDK